MHTVSTKSERQPVILIVDDDPDFLTDAQLLLETDFACDCASTVQEAMLMLNENSYEAILLDIHFGEGHAKGFELLRSLRRERRMLPVIMVSGDEKPTTVFQASQGGAQGFVGKSFKREELVRTLKDLIGRHRNIFSGGDINTADQDSWILSGSSDAATRLQKKLTKYSEQENHLLISGPDGSLKSSFARLIHQQSGLRSKSFCSLNHEQLQEFSATFANPDHPQNTGSSRRSLPARSTMGTVLIREIAQVSQKTQTSLASYFQHSGGERSGQHVREFTGPRVIVTTSTDLSRLVKEGRFNKTLYEMLARNELVIRPLVFQTEDISHLIEQYSWLLAKRMNRPFRSYTDEATKYFQAYDWQRNLAELAEAVQYAFLQTDDELIALDDLPPHIRYYHPNLNYKEQKYFDDEKAQIRF